MNKFTSIAISACIASAGIAFASLHLRAQGEVIAPLSKDYILLTIFLKHDESKSLDEINKELDQRNWTRDFPPQGVEVESWYVMMGIGQVVTLRVPPDKVREVNRMIEQKAWGPFRTEFYLTYDFKAAAKAAHDQALQGK
jgi:uncharacterized protein with GYD domain